MTPQPSILFIDDDRDVNAALSLYLRRQGFEVEGHLSAKSARQRLRERDFSLIITDVVMPEVDGLELLMALRSEKPDIPCIVISGGGMIDATHYLEWARLMGARQVLRKPVELAHLCAVVREVLAAGPGTNGPKPSVDPSAPPSACPPSS